MKIFTKVMMTLFVVAVTAVCIYTRWSIIGAPFMAVLALSGIWEKK
jgi:hypothetical protein